jgi:Mn2+/Fe2+ NRAMP family transporter
MLKSLGPGMILAGAIVGSGELIATPKVGAEAGFWLLWLVILGCILKVFTQIEIGQHTITWGQTGLAALNTLPGPRLRVNWLLWYWFGVVLLIISQNGGIVGGVGQSLAIAWPLTTEGEDYNRAQDEVVRARVELALARQEDAPASTLTSIETRLATLDENAAKFSEPLDVVLWSSLIAVLTSIMMYFGRYKFIEVVSTVLVGGFTVVTVVALFMLQSTPWAVERSDVIQGLRFQLPPGDDGGSAIATALAAFGMIGLSAGELIMYPYWCLEKGYAYHTGPRDQSPEWVARARGWMRVLQLDVWISMFVYTFATVAFYLLGAAVLSRTGLKPNDEEMVRSLGQMYVPVFGSWAEGIFLFGAFTVLYSTYFVFAAGMGRILADAMVLLGMIDGDQTSRQRWVRIFAVSLPILALTLYLFFRSPLEMVLAAGLGQATMMPMLGAAALYFRYRRVDPRLKPKLLRDLFLWLSFLGLLIIGTWSIYSNIL